VLVCAEGALAEWGYVVASRAREETRLYAVGPELVDDAGVAREQPEPATRRLVGALSRIAADPPAIERAMQRREGLRPARMARERLEREIESRERLLSSARQRFGDLGWIGRRRHGPALRKQIGGQERVLADLRFEMRELAAREELTRPAPVERPTLSRARERAIRQPIERGMGLER
jgi:hypothetical protein